jgi:hypothetical protein
MAICAVFFDAAGTLIKPVRRVGESYAQVAKKFAMDVSPAQLSERFGVCFGAAAPLAFPGAPDAAIIGLERDWWKRLVRQIFEPWEPVDRFDDYSPNCSTTSRGRTPGRFTRRSWKRYRPSNNAA